MTRRRSLLPLLLLALLLPLVLPDEAPAQEIGYRGSVVSDARFRFPGKDMPYEDEFAFHRTDNMVQSEFIFSWDEVEIVSHLRIRYTGSFNQISSFEDLTLRDRVDQYRIESDAIYIAIYDFLAPGLELYLGRQSVVWGKGDQFNPTSQLSGYFYDDRLEFGKPIANEMVRLVYQGPWENEGDWIGEGKTVTYFGSFFLEGVFIPVFRPNTVPSSALLAFSSPDLVAQFVNTPLLNGMVGILNAFLSKGGAVTFGVNPTVPDIDVENFQAGTRVGATLLGVDVSASYYYGFDKTPRARTVDVDTGGLPIPSNLIDPNDPNNLDPVSEFIGNLPDGSLNGIVVGTETELYYPRIHMVGADFETSLDTIGGVGLRGEFALFFHESEQFQINIPAAMATLEEQSLEAGLFWKLNVGLTYSVTSWWLLNVMYLRGFIDEFGERNIGDYVVAGSDFQAFGGQLLFRLFSIIELNDDTNTTDGNDAFNVSTVIHPAISFKFWQNTELMIGALVYVGDRDTKFGNPVTGANTGILRGIVSF